MKKITFILLTIAILLSACATAEVQPAQFEAVNITTREGVTPGSDAGGETYIRSEMPGEEKMKEFVACQMSAIHGNISAQDVNVTFTETGMSKPAKVYGCGSGDPTSGILVSTTMLASAPADVTILGVVFIVGVGIYAIVSAMAYFEANSISFSMTSAAAYTPAQLPTFANFNSGSVAPYTSYTTADFTFNTFGELASTVETVYFYDSAPTSESSLLGVYSVGQQVLYATTTDQGRAAYWTLPVAEWYELCQYARMAATADAGAAALPPIEWPKWDPDTSGWQHAANSRHWPILGIMLVYEAISHSADNVYYSPTLGYLLITTYDPFVGTIGSIFTTAQEVTELVGTGFKTIVPLNPVTIIFPIHGKIEAKRVRGCFSYPIWPPRPQETMYEPIGTLPGAIGTCLVKNADGTNAFNQ